MWCERLCICWQALDFFHCIRGRRFLGEAHSRPMQLLGNADCKTFCPHIGFRQLQHVCIVQQLHCSVVCFTQECFLPLAVSLWDIVSLHVIVLCFSTGVLCIPPSPPFLPSPPLRSHPCMACGSRECPKLAWKMLSRITCLAAQVYGDLFKRVVQQCLG